MKPKFKLIMNLCLSSLFLLTSCKSNYLDEFQYIQDNVTNQEYKIGDEETFDKISKDTNYEFEDYVSYKMFRSKDDLNYYYFNNENKLYRFLTYDTKSSILNYQIGGANKDQFYNNMDDTKKKKNGDFRFVVDDNAVYHRLSDFVSEEAREQFRSYLQKEKDLNELQASLENLRTAYHESNQAGKDQLAPGILDKERRVKELLDEIAELETAIRNTELEKTKIR